MAFCHAGSGARSPIYRFVIKPMTEVVVIFKYKFAMQSGVLCGGMFCMYEIDHRTPEQQQSKTIYYIISPDRHNLGTSRDRQAHSTRIESQRQRRSNSRGCAHKVADFIGTDDSLFSILFLFGPVRSGVL